MANARNDTVVPISLLPFSLADDADAAEAKKD
jgi:hypothetical protein